jgi:hypothetical protein
MFRISTYFLLFICFALASADRPTMLGSHMQTRLITVAPKDAAMLLQRAEVRKEIGFTAAQEKSRNSLSQQLSQLSKAGKRPDFSAFQIKLLGLLTPAQRNRLEQLHTQFLGTISVLLPVVGAKIGLTSVQRNKAQTIYSTEMAKPMALAKSGKKMNQQDLTALQKIRIAAKVRAQIGITKLLSTKQLQLLEKLKGKKFQFAPGDAEFHIN